MKKIMIARVVPCSEEELSPISIKINKHIPHTHFNSQSYHLTCGHSQVKANLEIENDQISEVVLKIGESIRKELQLPTIPFLSQLIIENENTLILGPIFAILTEIIPKEHGGISFKSIHSFCEEIAEYCETRGIIFYVFSLNAIVKNNMTGYMYTNKKWIETIVPLPNVVHNRIHSRKREMSEDFFQLIHSLQSKQIPYFNDHYLNKWESYTILKKHPHLHPYLPDTELLTTKEAFEHFLTHHEHIFIKPIHGSQGRRIIQITKRGENFLLDYTTFSGEIEKSIPSFAKLFQTLRPRIVKEAFIIQQGITFIQFQNNQVDFRILCHGNEVGKWEATSIVARVANEEMFVSNIARGGKILKAIDVLSEAFDSSLAKQILKLLKELAIEISSVISEGFDGFYGEFGIDLGVDKDGCPWIIEVNTKPSKNLDTIQELAKTRPSAKAIVHYAMYLSQLNR